jgi:GT2 family glycosyltransferase
MLPDATPMISIIIPHLNQPEALAACLQSLAAQSYPRERFEVIVVDNGSRELPTKVVGTLSGARLETEAEPGPGPARNRGVAISKGEILAFIDADCTADPNWLSVIARRLGSADDKTVLGGDVRIAVGDPERLTMLEAYESVFAYRQQEYIEKHGFSGTGNLAVRRRDFDAVGPFAGIAIAEDRDWGHRAAAKGFRIVYAGDTVVYHPARRSFDEMFAKWDRHIAHDFEEWINGGRGAWTWRMRALAVAASSLAHARKVLASQGLTGCRSRCLALTALVRIRLWRAGRMVALARTGVGRCAQMSWNRQ